MNFEDLITTRKDSFPIKKKTKQKKYKRKKIKLNVTTCKETANRSELKIGNSIDRAQNSVYFWLKATTTKNLFLCEYYWSVFEWKFQIRSGNTKKNLNDRTKEKKKKKILLKKIIFKYYKEKKNQTVFVVLSIIRNKQEEKYIYERQKKNTHSLDSACGEIHYRK